ncbi:MAG TPA: nitroreductase [Rhizomicrobium sp.]|jgi:nitroreductase|nr:nitroreductase [Rhizomicrobium sp.]
MNDGKLNVRDSGPLELLLTRRSGSAKSMTGPGPEASQLDLILEAAARVSDHGKLAPWRFIIFEGESRARFGELLAECALLDDPQASEERLRLERERFLRAPVIVGVVSRVREGIPIPEWEQILSAGAACQNLVLAAHALGYVANWITEWCAYHPGVRDRLGLKSGERIAGFVYLGSSSIPLEERKRTDFRTLVTRYGA